jgi:Tol biopolymer transport system component
MRSPNPAGQPPTTHFAFSASGSLVYVPARAPQGAQLSLAFVDVSGKIQPLGLPPRPYSSPRISPDGKALAVVTDDGKDAFVSIYDLKGGTSPRRLTFGGRNDLPIWSPDSQYITFQSDTDGNRSIFRQAAAGGAAERLTTPDRGDYHQPEAWRPDGRVLLFTVINTIGHYSLWTLSSPEPKPKVLFDVPNANRTRAAFSPDGRWLAYTSTEVGGRGQIFVQPFPPTGKLYQISSDGGRAPLWSPNGKQLVYNELDTNRLIVVDVRTQPTFSIGKTTPLPIEGTVQPGPSGPRNYDMTPDGKQFIVVMPSSTPQTRANRQSPSQINFVVNWFTELQQRVPVK